MADQSVKIMLGTINDVKEFVNIVGGYDFDIDLISGRYSVDAKSIMGIFSLDLSKPIEVKTHCTQQAAEKFFEVIQRFIV